jgi:hypothetical protein
MIIPYRYRPSIGFLLLVFIWLAVATFFWWGSREPDLDKVWRIEHRLKQQQSAIEVSAEERAALELTLERHPNSRILLNDEGKAMLKSWLKEGAKP